jgi:hypothetical protein
MPYYGSGKLAGIDSELFIIGMTIDITELKQAQRKIEILLQEINVFKDQLKVEILSCIKTLCQWK